MSLDAVALSKGEFFPKGAVANISYKRNALVNPQDFQASTLIASSISNAIISSIKVPYQALPKNVWELNEEIRAIGKGSIDFDALLNYCWRKGVPVISLSNLPFGLKKMDGAALKVGDRPVIILAKKNNSKSWLSFILAHELGHIALGHLENNSSIVDIALQQESTFDSDNAGDSMELEADKFALNILGGPLAQETQERWGDFDSAITLATNARAAANLLGCSAGHLILRYAFRTKRWPEAASALKFLREDFDAQKEIVKSMASGIAFDDLSNDVQDLIIRITGYSPLES
ncbi:ImmA/IrrE family metallo-endopeptidase [Polynucleobacter paneuropaeus]|nr:ImmA/IrrE family metallo-endopeptidase [Polynucleobacter paneuropaeus]